jgi:colanic acid/amylovoran biosynthesis glycosyltransferase
MPHVTIWTLDWLPVSQTFIRNQSKSLTRWSHSSVGVGRVVSPIDDETDLIVFGRTVRERARKAMAMALGNSERVRKAVASTEPDLIHAHFCYSTWTVLRASVSLRVPLVVTAHGADVSSLASGRSLRKAIYRARLRRALTYATTVIAVSETIRVLLVGLGVDESKIVVHHIGIPISPLPTSRLNPEWDLVFVGRLVEKKGLRDLLLALSILPGRDPKLRLVVVGDGPLRGSLTALARDLKLDVTFLGAQPASVVSSVMSRSRIFALPSKTASDGDIEGLPMVILEAGALGLPVVSTRHSGIPEAVEDNVTGILVDEGDYQGLARAIQRLLDDELLQLQLGAAARGKVEREFDVTSQTAALELLYDDALSRRRDDGVPE